MRRHSAYERTMLSLLVLLFLAAAGRGLAILSPSAYVIDREASIDAPRSYVWRHAADPTLRSNWEFGVSDILPLSEIEDSPGARRLVMFRLAGKSTEIEEIVVAWDEGAMWHARRTSDSYEAEVVISLSGEEDGPVTVHYEERRTYLSFPDRYIAPLRIRRLSEGVGGSLDTLRARVEKHVRDDEAEGEPPMPLPPSPTLR